MLVIIRHWLPIVTFCPVNSLPDLIWVSVEFKDTMCELYQARKRIRKIASGQRAFMEYIAQDVLAGFPMASAVEVRLAFNRHVVRVEHASVN